MHRITQLTSDVRVVTAEMTHQDQDLDKMVPAAVY